MSGPSFPAREEVLPKAHWQVLDRAWFQAVAGKEGAALRSRHSQGTGHECTAGLRALQRGASPAGTAGPQAFGSREAGATSRGSLFPASAREKQVSASSVP